MNAAPAHVQPAIPLQNGRRPHQIPYSPPPPPQRLYHSYPQHYQSQHQHFQQQHPQQQWYHFPQHMQSPMPRQYHQYSPMVTAPYPVPQNSAPMHHRPYLPQHAPTSSSMHSHASMLSPSSSNSSLHVPPPPSLNAPNQHLPPPTPTPPPPPAPAQRMPYYPPLPWFSFTNGSFPPKSSRRRRRRPAPQLSTAPVELPPREDSSTEAGSISEEPSPALQELVLPEDPVPVLSGPETPVTSHPPSEADSTQPTTPSSAIAQALTQKASVSSPKSFNRPTIPLLPIIPAIPNITLASRPSQRRSVSIASDATKITEPMIGSKFVNATGSIGQINDEDVSAFPGLIPDPTSPLVKTTPKSWADLVRTKTQSATATAVKISDDSPLQSNGFTPSKSESLFDVLSSFSIQNGEDETKLAFLEPRGLVNTGNMCYMNSILQILVFCIPFYDFLDKVGKRAAHSFKSDTPLLDAMIMFMREFPIIDSAVSVEQLRMRLRDNELEQYGDSFIPEFVYEIIRRLPRFSSMRRGHQQDAEEFLGFILEEMHEECVKAMKPSSPKSSSGASTPTNGPMSPTSESGMAGDGGWHEVGPKQKAAITRSSGAITTESPITKIFGGKLRSELRVQGMKNSVTLEPYQPLQLDIGAPNVNNITDALKGLTRSETLHGDFNSPRGPGVTATKQVTIETLPPVLILHLKRFQYDNTGGTQKIWKKIGYPLELDIPKEVFPQHKRGAMLAHGGLPKYRLIGVVYHHGKNASGGHYTVDVRRQDGREWIRLDDTVIRRVRSEDVAERGSEEDPLVLAAALEQHKREQNRNGNLFNQTPLQEEEQSQSEKGWRQVNGTASGSTTASKKWSGVVNGAATPTISSGKRTPIGRSSAKDNKVAYLLFYQRINA